MRWYLFPVNPNTKWAAFKGWQAMSTDSEAQWDAWEADGWWLGVDCEKTGVAVVDLDLYKPGAAESKASLGLPPTLMQTTPRGGEHHFYRGLCRSKIGFLPGVDIKSRGGLVVWYGTSNDAPIADLPENIKSALDVPVERKPAQAEVEDLPYNIARAREYLKTAEPAIEGRGGNDLTYKTIAKVRDLGVSVDTAHELMLGNWNGRCLPPWDDDELREIIEHVWTYAQNEAGAQALADDPRVRFAGVPGGDGDWDRHGDRYRLWSVAEALTRPKPTWLFPQILPAQAVGLAYGPQEVGKTWLCLDQALQCATGVAGYGREQSDPQDVVYFSGEGFDDLVHSRIAAWCAYREHAPAGLQTFHLLEDFPNVADDADVDILIDQITKRKLHPRLIVLDTYARVLAQAGLNENDPLDVMKFVRQAEALKRGFGCTVLAIHHSGKDLERAARGSNALLAAVDFAYEITANWDVKALQLRCAKMKAAPKFDPLHFEAVPQGDSLVFRGITPDAYRALTTVQDIYHPASVGAALARLKASEDSPASVYALATELYGPPGISEPAQETLAGVERIVSKLRTFSRGRLEQYATKEGWYPRKVCAI